MKTDRATPNLSPQGVMPHMSRMLLKKICACVGVCVLVSFVDRCGATRRNVSLCVTVMV